MAGRTDLGGDGGVCSLGYVTVKAIPASKTEKRHADVWSPSRTAAAAMLSLWPDWGRGGKHMHVVAHLALSLNPRLRVLIGICQWQRFYSVTLFAVGRATLPTMTGSFLPPTAAANWKQPCAGLTWAASSVGRQPPSTNRWRCYSMRPLRRSWKDGVELRESQIQCPLMILNHVEYHALCRTCRWTSPPPSCAVLLRFPPLPEPRRHPRSYPKRTDTRVPLPAVPVGVWLYIAGPGRHP